LISASFRFGLGLASAVQVIPGRRDMRSIIKRISDQLAKLRARRFLGIATPEEMAQIPRLQQQLGMMLGIAATNEIQGALAQLKQIRGRPRQALLDLFKAIRKFRSGGMAELREALLNLGMDMPDLIGGLLRDSAAFVRTVEAQLSQLPNSDVLIQQFRMIARSVFGVHRGLMAFFGKQGVSGLYDSLIALV